MSWFVAAIWVVAIAAHIGDAPREIVYASFSFGVVAGIVEWLYQGGAALFAEFGALLP